MFQSINVKSTQSYPLFLDVSLEELGGYLRGKYGSQDHYLIISNQTVANLYAGRLLRGFQECRTDLLIVPDGEEEKSLERISLLTEEALKTKADRDTVVLALGGGVIGDLAGFFAAIFLRGIKYIQIPTTFLAQIDSSIGGKVAVNHPAGKNMLGAFSNPQAIWTDFSTLKTLPWPEIQNGLAETVKHALIADPELFDFIEAHTEFINNKNFELLKELAIRSLAVKVKIVTEDEKEKGCRILLNLGHSFGHALEAAAEFKGLSHGQGVSVGLAAAAALSRDRGLLSSKDYDRIITLLEKMNLPKQIPACDPQFLLKHMEVDKKNKAGKKILVLPAGIGRAVVAADCEDAEIIRAWQKVMA